MPQESAGQGRQKRRRKIGLKRPKSEANYSSDETKGRLGTKVEGKKGGGWDREFLSTLP